MPRTSAPPARHTAFAEHSSTLARLKAMPTKPGQASFFYRDQHFQYDGVKVLPGEYFVSNEDIIIMTVLGSCIAACIWDPRLKAGGMNHFMLPDGGDDNSGRYGTYAMELLVNEMIKMGCRREHMQAKIFGGGQVMHSFTTMNVGERNTHFVTEYLQTERIAVVSKDVLDIHPRKVCYFPATGKAMVKRLAHSHPEKLERQERAGNAAVVVRSTDGGSVDLF